MPDKPDRNNGLVLPAVVFCYIFLLTGRWLLETLDRIGKGAIPPFIHYPAAIGTAGAIAFILSRQLFLGMQTGPIPYLLRLPLVRNLWQSIKHGRWHFSNTASSVLLIVICLAWMRSHWRADIMSVPFSDAISAKIVSCSGTVMLEYYNFPERKAAFKVDSRDSDEFEQSYEFWILRVSDSMGKTSVSGKDYSLRAFLAKDWSFTRGGLPYRMMSVNLPYWLFALILAVLPCLTIRKGFVRYRRSVTAHCPECGYNLTGNVSGTCPECGEQVSGSGVSQGVID